KMTRRIVGALPGLKPPGAGRFFYPRHGYGQISRALAEAARGAGAEIRLHTPVQRVCLGTPHRIEVECAGQAHAFAADYIWSTMPLPGLARMVVPRAPKNVLDACEHIGYRAMVLVYLLVAQTQFTPFDAHYFPESHVPLTRLSEPKNYSGSTDPEDRTVLCAEIPCAVHDRIWRASDAQVADLVREALAASALSIRAPILQVVTKRLLAAYPIYRRAYEEPFKRLDDWIAGLDRVLTFGRQGLFAHDNTHHTLAMAYDAVDCLNAAGEFDWKRWQKCRREFAAHVVED
ncbi:MAG: protoporphyrinogen/coproporphyrinogen oxidase, partial [Candidatus Binatia bacterium]